MSQTDATTIVCTERYRKNKSPSSPDRLFSKIKTFPPLLTVQVYIRPSRERILFSPSFFPPISSDPMMKRDPNTASTKNKQIPSHYHHLYDYKRIPLEGKIPASEKNRIRQVSNPRYFLSKIAAPPIILAQSLNKGLTELHSLGRCNRRAIPRKETPQSPILSPIPSPSYSDFPTPTETQAPSLLSPSLEKQILDDVFELTCEQDIPKTQFFIQELENAMENVFEDDEKDVTNTSDKWIPEQSSPHPSFDLQDESLPNLSISTYHSTPPSPPWNDVTPNSWYDTDFNFQPPHHPLSPTKPLNPDESQTESEAFNIGENRTHLLSLLNQNVRSWRSESRRANIDAAIGVMIKHNIDIYTVQETWLDGSTHLDVNDYHVFTHGHDTQSCARGQNGVAIILSPHPCTARM